MRTVVVAPDSFKGSCTAADAARAIRRGWLHVRPTDDVRVLPQADGGEGTLDALYASRPHAAWGPLVAAPGPDDRIVDARWLDLGDGHLAVELASTSGLPLMEHPAPRTAHTAGLGALLAHAISDSHATRLTIGLGGSASTDGGAGALQALGARLLDARGRSLPRGGAALIDLARVDLDGLVAPPPGGVRLLVDVEHTLLGTGGAAAVFGPQKGADDDDVRRLDDALARFAQVLGETGLGDARQPGSGAAGGTAFGLVACWRAEIVPGAATIAAISGLDQMRPDVLITGEGRFDHTSLGGKVVGHALTVQAGTHAIVAGDVDPACVPDDARAVSLTALAGSSEAALRDPERWLELAGAELAQLPSA